LQFYLPGPLARLMFGGPRQSQATPLDRGHWPMRGRLAVFFLDYRSASRWGGGSLSCNPSSLSRRLPLAEVYPRRTFAEKKTRNPRHASGFVIGWRDLGSPRSAGLYHAKRPGMSIIPALFALLMGQPHPSCAGLGDWVFTRPGYTRSAGWGYSIYNLIQYKGHLPGRQVHQRDSPVPQFWACARDSRGSWSGPHPALSSAFYRGGKGPCMAEDWPRRLTAWFRSVLACSV